MILFVDSGAHIALLDPDDQHRRAAVGFLEGLELSRFVTTNLVLSEVATRAARLVGARAAAAYVEGVLTRPSYRMVGVGRSLLEEALRALVKYEDQGLSLTDCTTLLLARAARKMPIFTFDQAFRRLGLQVVP